MKRVTSLASFGLLAACAATTTGLSPRQSADQWALAEARPVGEPVNCVRTGQIRDTHVRSNQVIDFEMHGGQTLRNTLPNSCPGLNVEERFGYTTVNSQLCSVDTITVLRSGAGPGATCGLGQFQPIELPPRR